MNKKALDFLIEQAKEKTKHSVKRLANAQTQLQESQRKLNTLDTYIEECQSRIYNTQGLTFAGQISNQLSFINKVNDARQMQQRHVEFCVSAVDMGRVQLKKSELTRLRFEALDERYTKLQQLQEDRTQQKANDEFASQMVLRQQKSREGL